MQQTPDPQDPAEGDASAAAADSAAPVRSVRQLRTRGPVRQPKRGTDVEPDPAAPAAEDPADETVDTTASAEPPVARPVRSKPTRTNSPRSAPSEEAATTNRPALKRPAPKKPAAKAPAAKTTAAKRPAAAKTVSTTAATPADASRPDTNRVTDSSPAALDGTPGSAAAPTPTKPSERRPPAPRTSARSTTKRAVRAPKAGQKVDPAAQEDVAASNVDDERELVEGAPAVSESSAVRAPRTAAAELVRDPVAVAPASVPAGATADVAESNVAVEFAGAPIGTDEPAEGLDSSTDLVEEFEAIVAPPVRPAPRKKRPKVVLTPAPVAPPETAEAVLQITGLSKSFGDNHAVDGIDLSVRTGSFYGIVGPNGAGKTTTLSMVTGLLRPDAGSVLVHDIDVWAKPAAAKRVMGVLPDRLRLFDRLTGAQLLYYSGVLRGLDTDTVRSRSADLVSAFGLDEAVNRLVADYSAGMTKKIALACAMIHSPRLLVLDEPFESVDPVSAANLVEILQRYVGAGGTVVLSSHGMDMIERVCDSVAVIIQGKVLASGTLDEVRRGQRLEDRFVELAGGRKVAEGMEWLHSFSD